MSSGGSNVDNRQKITAGVYTIDPARSVISFQTRAMWGLMGVKGTFALHSGRVTVAEPVTESTVEATVSADSFSSGITQRDDHVRSSDYLDAANHPHFVFAGERFEWSGTSGTLHGQLTVKEVTKPVTLDVTDVSGGEQELTARATTTIDRHEFGVTHDRGKTGRKLRLTLDVVATR